MKPACRAAVEIAGGLVRYAFAVSSDGEQASISELKRVVSIFLLEYAAPDTGHPGAFVLRHSTSDKFKNSRLKRLQTRDNDTWRRLPGD